MILKTAANYNDEGGYIEAWKNSDGTTGVKLIPKSGGDEGKNGIESISISPAITTTPALDSLFPIYWEDLTDEEKLNGVTLNLNTDSLPGGEYSITVTPTAEGYAFGIGDTNVASENAGAPITYTQTTVLNQVIVIECGMADTTEDIDESKVVKITINIGSSQ